MHKTFRILSLAIFFSLSLFSFVFCATPPETSDSIRIVTYYPSPYGSYGELRSKRIAVGSDYMHAGNLPWNSGGPCMPNQICNADLVVAGNVGIGTTEPAQGYKLDVRGNIRAAAFNIGDITFTDQETQKMLWRMFEDEQGLYLENIKTGKVYRFVLQAVDKK